MNVHINKLRFSLSTRGSQLESANAHEIKCDILLAYTMFKLENSIRLMVAVDHTYVSYTDFALC